MLDRSAVQAAVACPLPLVTANDRVSARPKIGHAPCPLPLPGESRGPFRGQVSPAAYPPPTKLGLRVEGRTRGMTTLRAMSRERA